MQKDLVKYLECPKSSGDKKCKGNLTLEILEEKDSEVTRGFLTCEICKAKYEIKEGIPILLDE